MHLRLVDKTLAEQLKITERDIEDRKRLIGFEQSDVDALTSFLPLVKQNIDIIVRDFYDRQIHIPEIQLLIGDAETFNRLHSSMKGYVAELFEGRYDYEYVNKRLRIGKIHNRIGVSPKLYISAIYLLEDILSEFITKHTNFDGCASCNSLKGALKKVIAFDTQFVFDTYINSLVTEVESAKGEVESYAKNLESIVAQRTQQLEVLSSQDYLTGLSNQRSFYDELRSIVLLSARMSCPVCLVYFDLNKFKSLNDKKGHKEGDQLLRLVGDSLRVVARESDLIARYGGDEFCAILPNTHIAAAEAFCNRLISEFDQQITHDVTFSVGICELNTGNATITSELLDDFVKQADSAMYQSKEKAKLDGKHHVTSVKFTEEQPLVIT